MKLTHVTKRRLIELIVVIICIIVAILLGVFTTN